MKFNDREIIMKGNGAPDIEGVLHYLRPQSNEWSTWYSAAPSFKERKFKLVANLLFYYRIGEFEPLGVIVLENAQIKHERPLNGVFFPFSIQFTDEQQHKYIFSCRCQEEANNWVSKLNSSSYEYWRTQLVILQKKISMRTGKDPVTLYTGNQAAAERLSWSKKQVGACTSSFQCHVNDTPSLTNPFLVGAIPQMDINQRGRQNINKNEIPIEDLIQF